MSNCARAFPREIVPKWSIPPGAVLQEIPLDPLHCIPNKASMGNPCSGSRISLGDMSFRKFDICSSVFAALLHQFWLVASVFSLLSLLLFVWMLPTFFACALQESVKFQTISLTSCRVATLKHRSPERLPFHRTPRSERSMLACFSPLACFVL